MRAFPLLALVLAACPSVPTTERTLDNCATTAGAEVPAFYKEWFRCTTMAVKDGVLEITTNGLPPHRTAYYGEGHPNWTAFDTSRGSEYRQNPNVLEEQDVTFRIPLAPVKRAGVVIDPNTVDGAAGTSQLEYDMGAAGVAPDGVLLFNALAAPGDDIEAERFTFDDYDAHPAPDGAYHYHSTSKGPLEALAKNGLVTSTVPGGGQAELYGIMCDGTLVLGCKELDQSEPDKSDLDAQNGHLHELAGKGGEELLPERYHVHLCPSKWKDHPRAFTPEIRYYDSCTR